MNTRAGGIPWGVCLVFIFLQLLPRFDMIVHSHAHGGDVHHHGFLSAHDVALEKAALAAYVNGSAQEEPNFDAANSNDHIPTPSPPLIALESGDAGVAPQDGFAHTHYQEDPNLLGLNDLSPPPCTRLATLDPPEHPATRPASAAGLVALARAPPRIS